MTLAELKARAAASVPIEPGCECGPARRPRYVKQGARVSLRCEGCGRRTTELRLRP